MEKSSKYIVYFLIISILALGGCEKKIESEPDPDNNNPAVPLPEEISQYIWEGLYDYYLWVGDVDKLSPDHYPANDDFNAYLNTFGINYDDLFYDLLYQYGTVDKWSWIVDDYHELEASFAGISKSMGYDFRLVRFSGSDDIFGYIRYVLPDSPADFAGIVRGDLFMKVNGQQLNINNYISLLFEQDSYTLSLAAINEANQVYLTGVTKDLIAVELQENPVFHTSVMDIGGVKTGYLVYNSFTSDFNIELNDAFAWFKSEGIGRLILDMRYNGGGSIRTAIYLASKIYSTNPKLVFSKVTYNTKLQEYLLAAYGSDYFNYYFADKVDTITVSHSAPPGLPAINNLGLSELYVITTTGTASASELVINGLDPYINVTLVGENTTGKYVGSITVYDWDSNGDVNPDHTWAMQPIILKIANSLNVSDYVSGLLPDVEAEEDIANLLPFGDPEETLLKATIDHILGNPAKKSLSALTKGVDYRVIADSKDFIPHSKEMYLELNRDSFLFNFEHR
ncbi:MAG: hypothetical protein K8R35_02315 [Bacteroidales bacterium]|nr:hypothetical protein [Bacteroidales bacterium]